MKSLRDGLLSAFSLIRTWSSGETEAKGCGEHPGELGPNPCRSLLWPQASPCPTLPSCHGPGSRSLGQGGWDAHRAHSRGCGSSSGWLHSGQWSRRWAQPGRHREPATPWLVGPGCGGGPPYRPRAEGWGSAQQPGGYMGGQGGGLPPHQASSPGSCVQWRCPCWTGRAPRTRRVCCCGSWGWAAGHR